MRSRRASALTAALWAAGCGFQSTSADDGGVVPAAFDVTPSQTSVDEHEQFSVHVVARDAQGAIARGYSGTPAITSDWGDARVVGSAQLTQGEAQLTLALNRETNAAFGLAHLHAADGAANGVSSGVTVTAPTWLGLPTETFSAGGANTWDVAVANPSWNISGTGYRLWYTGRDMNGVPAIGLAVSMDAATWTRDPGNPIFTGLPGGFEKNGVVASAVVLDDAAAQFLLLYGGDGTLFDQYGLAVSPDGRAWTRRAPVTPALGAVCPTIAPPVVLAVESPGHYRIFFGTGAGLCTATSGDAGLTWSAAGAMDGLTAGGGVLPVAVVRDGSVWRFWYYTNETGYATSSDAITWIPSPAASLAIGTAPNTVAWSDANQRYEGLAAQGFLFVAATRP